LDFGFDLVTTSHHVAGEEQPLHHSASQSSPHATSSSDLYQETRKLCNMSSNPSMKKTGFHLSYRSAFVPRLTRRDASAKTPPRYSKLGRVPSFRERKKKKKKKTNTRHKN
jgi:hypothetical protein